MIDLTLKQQSFAKNDIPTRLHQLAENLSKIKNLYVEGSHQESILNLAKHSDAEKMQNLGCSLKGCNRAKLMAFSLGNLPPKRCRLRRSLAEGSFPPQSFATEYSVRKTLPLTVLLGTTLVDLGSAFYFVSVPKESRYFIEWTVPDMVLLDIDQAAELVDLGRVLTHWLFNREKIWSDATEKSKAIQLADDWFERVLQISLLQSQSITA
ncbi:MAG: hypothetical protein PUP92_17950 [Rhizonema sp. PD38]|nr:hypothetical protein [Rhizonema sp. PD38]